jgi:hypothetical protein
MYPNLNIAGPNQNIMIALNKLPNPENLIMAITDCNETQAVTVDHYNALLRVYPTIDDIKNL